MAELKTKRDKRDVDAFLSNMADENWDKKTLNAKKRPAV